MSDQLSDLRISLDNIDNAVVFLLAERFRVTHKVGLYKKANQLPPVDPAREAAQFERVRTLAQAAGLDADFAESYLRLVINQVVEEHKKLAAVAQA